MAGLYIHVPYCHKACHYCNFHFSTSLKDMDKMVDSICTELLLRKDYLDQRLIETVYFGGGTPSILSSDNLSKIFHAIHDHYSIASSAEITLEANPEDITETSLLCWKSLGVNRLSIGIQSFQNEYLHWMNRNHSSEASIRCVTLAQKNGFENISIDLIYGLPTLTVDQWRAEIQTAISLNVPHISSYCLTVEEKTVFGNLAKKGALQPIPDEISEEHLIILIHELLAAGYEQYEISNFCKPAFESKHNSSYWQRKPYIGIGPGAHSYNDRERAANISNNSLYIKQIEKNEWTGSIEILSDIDQYNEYILTRLRTKWGITLIEIEAFSLPDIEKTIRLLTQFVNEGFLYIKDDIYLLTTKGKLLADEITLQLMH